MVLFIAWVGWVDSKEQMDIGLGNFLGENTKDGQGDKSSLATAATAVGWDMISLTSTRSSLLAIFKYLRTDVE